MFTKIRDYLIHLSSNMFFFSKATAASSITLTHLQATKKIAKQLITISVEDYIPAAIAYSIQQQLSLEESSPSSEDPPSLSMALLGNYILYLGLAGFIINRSIHGAIRSRAMMSTIPLLLNEETLEEITNPDGFELDEFSHKQIRQMMNLSDVYLLETAALLLLPYYYYPTQLFLKFRSGYQIVNWALDEKTMRRLTELNINSLPLLISSAYALLGTILKNGMPQELQNPYLHLLIDNGVYIALFSIVANLRLEHLALEPELHSLDPTRLIRYSPLRGAIYHHLVLPILKNSSAQKYRDTQDALFMYNSFLKQTLLPRMLQSPKTFFDDEVISHLLELLPEKTKEFVLAKYSKPQIQRLLTTIKHRDDHRPHWGPDEAIRTFIELYVEPWVHAFEEKLLSTSNLGRAYARHGMFRIKPIPMPDEFKFFDKLPVELKERVAKHLELNDIAALAQTSRLNHLLFQPVLNGAKIKLDEALGEQWNRDVVQ